MGKARSVKVICPRSHSSQCVRASGQPVCQRQRHRRQSVETQQRQVMGGFLLPPSRRGILSQSVRQRAECHRSLGIRIAASVRDPHLIYLQCPRDKMAALVREQSGNYCVQGGRSQRSFPSASAAALASFRPSILTRRAYARLFIQQEDLNLIFR